VRGRRTCTSQLDKSRATDCCCTFGRARCLPVCQCAVSLSQLCLPVCRQSQPAVSASVPSVSASCLPVCRCAVSLSQLCLPVCRCAVSLSQLCLPVCRQSQPAVSASVPSVSAVCVVIYLIVSVVLGNRCAGSYISIVTELSAGPQARESRQGQKFFSHSSLMLQTARPFIQCVLNTFPRSCVA
jgi:hypothetical protein